MTIYQLFYRDSFWIALCIVGCYFLLFFNLGRQPLYMWDESLFANRAFYLAEHGEYFVNWNDVDHCEINHANTKPPLVTFIQAVSFKIFGYSAWALRLPSAIFGLLTGLLMVYFFHKVFRQAVWGVLAAAVLWLAPGFNAIHILQSGDHDAALAFFLFLSLLFFYFSLWSKQKMGFYLIFGLLATGMAILTKSIIGFMFLPAVFLWFIAEKSFQKIVFSKQFWIGCLLIAAMLLGFYGVMEWQHPGFLKFVWNNELGGRYSKSIDGHSETWYFYLQRITGSAFRPWIFFVPFGIFFTYYKSSYHLKRWISLLLITCGFYLLVISLAKTKLDWYAAPIYPILSVFSALGLWYILMVFLPRMAGNHFSKLRIAGAVLLTLFLSFYTYNMVREKATQGDYWNIVQYEKAMKQLHIDRPDLNHYKVFCKNNNEWYPNIIFTANVLELNADYQIELVNDLDTFSSGDWILGFYNPVLENYSYKEMSSYDEVKLYRLD